MNRDRSLVTTSAAIQQLYTLPIPSGALVIDIRGLDDDDVLATLQGEIKNLASEMNMQQVDHWRYLTSFIEVLSLTPLTLDEIKALGAEGDKQQQQQQQKRTRSIT